MDGNLSCTQYSDLWIWEPGVDLILLQYSVYLDPCAICAWNAFLSSSENIVQMQTDILFAGSSLKIKHQNKSIQYQRNIYQIRDKYLFFVLRIP